MGEPLKSLFCRTSERLLDDGVLPDTGKRRYSMKGYFEITKQPGITFRDSNSKRILVATASCDSLANHIIRLCPEVTMDNSGAWGMGRTEYDSFSDWPGYDPDIPILPEKPRTWPKFVKSTVPAMTARHISQTLYNRRSRRHDRAEAVTDDRNFS